MFVGLLAALSASAAAGMRIALPLLVIGLLHGGLWYNVPVLAASPPQVLLGIFTSWSLFELFASKKLLGQRSLQLVELAFSPIVGALLAIAAVQIAPVEFEQYWLIGIVGGLFAFVLKLVQIGWFFRLQGLPIWLVIGEDALCIFLVFFAFKAPQQGGLIAMLLLWLSVRSSTEWYRWYKRQPRLKSKERDRGS